ncbi:MAG: DUF1249 domain-containing protein [Gammaproteobacteria bacterium]|nr:DUF1249 domain-containing protein [Gammaproteobacteria bacterium]
MVSFRQKSALYLKPRLARLQDVQEELYRQLQLLIPEQVAYHDWFQSRVGDSPLLRMEILERHPYTQFLRLTYQFDNGEDPELAPDAHIRLYQDARLAEVTAFDAGQGCRRSAHPWYPPRQLMQKTWRLNLALDKWLGYLLQQGHSVDTMKLASECIGNRLTTKIAVTAG